jgi:hypothetical protein
VAQRAAAINVNAMRRNMAHRGLMDCADDEPGHCADFARQQKKASTRLALKDIRRIRMPLLMIQAFSITSTRVRS